MENKFKNKEELFYHLRGIFGYEEASDEEKSKWPYDCNLYTSPKNLIGKKFYNKDKSFIGIVDGIEFGKNRTRDGLSIIVGEKKYSISYYYAELEDKIKGETMIYPLHPARKGKNFWENGFVVDEKTYKSMYYVTNEYREVFQSGMFDSYGLVGINSPGQIEEVQDKIKKTMFENHGVESFLTRGYHYSAITSTMIERYGVENLFFDEKWQTENLSHNKGYSKIELSIIKKITSEIDFGKEVYYFSENIKQKCFFNEINKKKYIVDFYSKSKNIIIEIFGDYWHCNPNVYDKEFYNRNVELFSYEIWERDNNRRKFLSEDLKINYYVIWEGDWKKDKNKIINEIKNILNENI